MRAARETRAHATPPVAARLAPWSRLSACLAGSRVANKGGVGRTQAQNGAQKRCSNEGATGEGGPRVGRWGRQMEREAKMGRRAAVR